MAMILHDLVATGDRRFSPYCWRTKLALAHKGLEYETRPVRFTDIDALSAGGPRLSLPTLDDGETRVVDSWEIAEHLERSYPDSSSLFPTGREVARFVQGWTNSVLNVAVIKVVLMAVYDALDEENQAYFRESREKRFGVKLESVVADRPGALKALRQALQPMRDVLAAQPFLSGVGPAYADYIPAGAFLWAEAVGETGLLEPGDPVAHWLNRTISVLGD